MTFATGIFNDLSDSNSVADPEAIDLDKIWHKFYTVDQSHNRKSSGTGLGLSVVKTILEQYGAVYNVCLDKDTFVFEFELDMR